MTKDCEHVHRLRDSIRTWIPKWNEQLWDVDLHLPQISPATYAIFPRNQIAGIRADAWIEYLHNNFGLLGHTNTSTDIPFPEGHTSSPSNLKRPCLLERTLDVQGTPEASLVGKLFEDNSCDSTVGGLQLGSTCAHCHFSHGSGKYSHTTVPMTSKTINDSLVRDLLATSRLQVSLVF